MAIRKIVSRSIGVDVIVAEDLADNSITAAEITNGAVTADKLASNSVTTAKITDANVTTGKLASSITITTLTGTNDASISGLTVGKGTGSLALNTAVGAGALASTNTGDGQCSAFGFQVLNANTSGAYNTGVGLQALLSNTTGSSNIAIGGASLRTNTTGGNNTGVGFQALNANTTASNNTAVGYQAGYSNTTGLQQTFIGERAGTSNTTGNGNTFVGRFAGFSNTTGSNNTFIGYRNTDEYGAGHLVTTGSKNTIIGSYNGNQGSLDIRTSSNHIVLSDGDGNPRGYFDNNGWFYALKGQTVQGVTCHQFGGNGANSYEMVIYNTNASPASEYIVDIKFTGTTPNNTNARFLACTDTTNEKAAILSTGGFLSRNNSYGTYSDVKLKENIVDATPKLDKLNQLQVRNFNFKDDDLTQIGFIAQEFEQVFPGLVEESQDRGANGEILETTTKSIKTSVLVPMLVKAIQELKVENDALKARLDAAGL